MRSNYFSEYQVILHPGEFYDEPEGLFFNGFYTGKQESLK
jgi:hypothetical protein